MSAADCTMTCAKTMDCGLHSLFRPNIAPNSFGNTKSILGGGAKRGTKTNDSRYLYTSARLREAVESFVSTYDHFLMDPSAVMSVVLAAVWKVWEKEREGERREKKGKEGKSEMILRC